MTEEIKHALAHEMVERATKVAATIVAHSQAQGHQIDALVAKLTGALHAIEGKASEAQKKHFAHAEDTVKFLQGTIEYVQKQFSAQEADAAEQLADVQKTFLDGINYIEGLKANLLAGAVPMPVATQLTVAPAKDSEKAERPATAISDEDMLDQIHALVGGVSADESPKPQDQRTDDGTAQESDRREDGQGSQD